MIRPPDTESVAPVKTSLSEAPEAPEREAVRDPWSPDGRALIHRSEVANSHADQPQQPQTVSSSEPQRVLVTGFDVPFGSLVLFGIKLVLAAVPAIVLLMLIVAGLFAIAGTLLGGAIMTLAASALSQALAWIGWPW